MFSDKMMQRGDHWMMDFCLFLSIYRQAQPKPNSSGSIPSWSNHPPPPGTVYIWAGANLVSILEHSKQILKRLANHQPPSSLSWSELGTAQPQLVHHYFPFLARAAALQSVAVRRSTGNDVSGPLFSPLFSIFSIFFFPFSVATFSHRRSARIKKLI